MKLAYLTVALLAAVLLAVPAPASPACGSGHCIPAVGQAPVVGHKAVVEQEVVAGFVLPAYGSGLVSTGYGSDDETKELLKQLLQEVKQLRQDLAAKGPGDAPAGDPVGTLNLTSPNVQAVLQKSCASCHTGEAKSGGGFALYVDDKTAVKLSPADRREVERKVRSGQMPKAPAKLSAADKDLVLKAVAAGK